MKVCRVAEIRQLDRRAIEEFGVPAEILMENAGTAAYQVIRQEFGVKNKNFVVLCGPGNNGGDGLVVARHLHSAGAEVKVFVLVDREKYRGEAKKNLDILAHFPLEIIEVRSVEQIKPDITTADAIVDALLGTGLDREVEGIIREVMELVNRSGKQVFALDIARGLAEYSARACLLPLEMRRGERRFGPTAATRAAGERTPRSARTASRAGYPQRRVR
jgi:NAD(P)H-hydrate epimerase